MLHDFQEESISQPEIPTYLSNCTPKRQKQWIIDSSPLQTSSPVPIPCQTWQSGTVVKRVLDKYISGWIKYYMDVKGHLDSPFWACCCNHGTRPTITIHRKNRPAVLPFQLQDVHDEMFCSPVDGWMQFMQSQLVLQHIFLLIVDLNTMPSSPIAQKNGSTGGYGKSRWKLEHVSFSISHKSPAPPSLSFSC